MRFQRLFTPVRALASAALLSLSATIASPVSAKDFTVVIDAGHGGHDAGAVGATTREKDIVLSVARKLGDIFRDQQKDVKVLLTRSTDDFVTLDGRVRKGKDASADLFISIHCNSTSKNRQTVKGTEVWVLGPDAADANLDLALRENQSILLEKDHSTRYAGFDNSPEYYIFNEISQNRMQGKSNEVAGYILNELVDLGLENRGLKQTSKLFLLLHATVPTVLVELDFICNPALERYLASETNLRRMAQAIANGVAKFRGDKASAVKPEKEPKLKETPQEKSQEKPEAKPEKPAGKKARKAEEPKQTADEIVYKIQIATSSRELRAGAPELKGLEDTDFYRDGRAYKYTVGSYRSQAEAARDLREIRKKFPDAFVIKTLGGKRIK